MNNQHDPYDAPRIEGYRQLGNSDEPTAAQAIAEYQALNEQQFPHMAKRKLIARPFSPDGSITFAVYIAER